jgi:hypothetical protein
MKKIIDSLDVFDDGIYCFGAELCAEKLLHDQKGKPPIQANPSTTVHNLVMRLRELAEWYSF